MPNKSCTHSVTPDWNNIQRGITFNSRDITYIKGSLLLDAVRNLSDIYFLICRQACLIVSSSNTLQRRYYRDRVWTYIQSVNG